MDRICLFSMRVFIAGAWNPQGVRLMAGEATGEQFQFFKEGCFMIRHEAGRASLLILGQEERT